LPRRGSRRSAVLYDSDGRYVRVPSDISANHGVDDDVLEGLVHDTLTKNVKLCHVLEPFFSTSAELWLSIDPFDIQFEAHNSHVGKLNGLVCIGAPLNFQGVREVLGATGEESFFDMEGLLIDKHCD
jgi:hypothetical protein